MKTQRGDFNPFTRGHCAVVAWAHLAGQGRSRDFMFELAARMKKVGKVEGFRVLDERGSARLLMDSHVATWAAEIGVTVFGQRSWYKVRDLGRNRRGERIGKAVAVPGHTPTLAAFIRKYKRGGRWLVITPDHAVAVVNGRPRGDYSPRSYVLRAYRIIDGPVRV